MYIENLALQNYRNYARAEITFSDGINILYGDNAQGKTNILEAIYLIGTTKSHRGSKDREIIRFDADESHIRAEIKKDGMHRRIDMHLKKSKSKGIAIDMVPIRRSSELLWFSFPRRIFLSSKTVRQSEEISWIWNYASWIRFM